MPPGMDTIPHLDELSPAAKRFVLEAGARGAKRTSQEIYAMSLFVMEQRLDRPLLEATKDHLLELKTMLVKERSGPGRAATARMFYKANDRDDLARALRMGRRVVQPRKLRAEEILDESDVNALLEASVSLRDRCLISVLFDLGARISDVLAINLADLNRVVSEENGGEVHYRVALRIQKTDDAASLLLIDSAPYVREWLERYPGPKKPKAALMWSWVNGRLSDAGTSAILRKAARRAGVKKPIHPHAFRHARATSYLRQGLTEAQTCKLMGWKPGSKMIGRYSHLVDQDAEDAKLRASGRKPPRKPVPGGLIKPEVLQPVVPVQPPAGRERFELQGAEPAEIPADVDLERLAHAIVVQLEERAAGMPAPAWATDQGREDLRASIVHLQQKVEILEHRLAHGPSASRV